MLPFPNAMTLGSGSGPSVPAARYWRLLMVSNSDSGIWLGAAEIEMAVSAGGADVTSSSFAIGSNNNTITDGAESLAFDNNTSNYWQYSNGGGSGYHWGKWIGQDFGAGNSKAIVEVRILPIATANGRSPGRFFLQYSSTGLDGSWTTVCGFKNLSWTDGVWNTFNVATPSTMAFGPERFTDPGFDSPASWIATGGWSISGSNAVGSTAGDELAQTSALVNGKVYVTEFNYTASLTGGRKLGIWTEADTNLFLSPALASSGFISGMYTANGTKFRLRASVDFFTGSIPSISTKEIVNY